MTIETLQKRIEGKQKELDKLNKKMSRILAAQATNWEKNPYYYSEYDIKCTQRDIDTAQKVLDKYSEELVLETKKAASRNIPVILEFLALWKTRVTESYNAAFERYLVAKAEWYAHDSEYVDWCNSHNKYSAEEKEEYLRRYNEHKKEHTLFQRTWNFITPYVDRKYNEDAKHYDDILNMPKLQKDLDREADAKYDFIVDRTCEIVGTITDASNLCVGNKGDLNGFIIGTDGTAKVQTISAEGPIQCFHYRTLIHRMK